MKLRPALWVVLGAAVLMGTSQRAAAQEGTTAVHPRLVTATPEKVAVGDDIEVTFDDANNKWVQSDEAQHLILYLNGRALKTGKPRWGGEGTGRVSFTLMRDGASTPEWAALLGRPSFALRDALVQVGLEGQAPFPGNHAVKLSTLDQKVFWMFVILVTLLLWVFVLLAGKSDVLRDGSGDPGAPARRPFSLARTQIAFWFFLVLASFIFIWIVTGAYDPLTPSVLALIGISAGTAMSAAIIDKNKQVDVSNRSTAANDERRRLETDIAALRTAVQQAQTAIAGATAGTDVNALQAQVIRNQAEIASKTERIAQITVDSETVIAAAVQPRSSEGFVADILSDDNGVSFHRFQIAVWTVVLGIIFAYTVYDGVAMPEFDAKLLGLLGISAGTYLGFKFPENT